MAQAIATLSAYTAPRRPALRFGTMLREIRRRAAERADLARFDARELQDIGLTSADRAAIIATPIWREAASRR